MQLRKIMGYAWRNGAGKCKMKCSGYRISKDTSSSDIRRNCVLPLFVNGFQISAVFEKFESRKMRQESDVELGGQIVKSKHCASKYNGNVHIGIFPYCFFYNINRRMYDEVGQMGFVFLCISF